MNRLPRIVSLLTLAYGLSALATPRPLARAAALGDPDAPDPAVRLLSGLIGVRDVLSGAAILVAPRGRPLLSALAVRAALDAGDAASFGTLCPTWRARRKIAAIAVAWGSISAASARWAG